MSRRLLNFNNSDLNSDIKNNRDLDWFFENDDTQTNIEIGDLDKSTENQNKDE